MKIWAIADLHLSFGTPDKEMSLFGPDWQDHADKIERNWRKLIAQEDLVIVAGDISWAKKLPEALVDLEWLHALPGTKVILEGNHDYWWDSLGKVQRALPPSIIAVQSTPFRFGDVSLSGTRLWDTPEYSFGQFIERRENPREGPKVERDDERIFVRELGRLETALKAIDQEAPIKIVMTHYPPIGSDLAPSRASKLIEAYDIDYAIFGHLHAIRKGEELFGKARGVTYCLTSADYLDFCPILIAGSN